MSKRYQALSPNDKEAPVDVFPLYLLDHLGIELLDKVERAAIAGILARQDPPDLRQLVGGKSFNAAQVVAVTMLLCGSPEQQRAGRDFMARLNRYQLGLEEPPTDLAILRFHGGQEQLGEYWPWRWFCDSLMLLAGLQRGDAELGDLGRRALAAHAALAALVMVPEEPVTEKGGMWSNAKGRQILLGAPFPLLAGERLNMAHVNGQQLAMCFCETVRWPYAWKRPELFSSVLLIRYAVQVAVKAGIDFPAFRPGGLAEDGKSLAPEMAAALAGIRLRGQTRVIRWADYAVAMLEEALNHNTAGMLAVGFDRRTRRPQPVFPFEGGREFQWKGSAVAEIQGSRLIASGPGGEAFLDLPAGPPLLEISLGPEGVKVVSGAPGTLPAPVPPLPGPEPSSVPPSPDPESQPVPPKPGKGGPPDRGEELRQLAREAMALAKRLEAVASGVQ